MLSNVPKLYSHNELLRPAPPVPSTPAASYEAALYAVGEALL